MRLTGGACKCCGRPTIGGRFRVTGGGIDFQCEPCRIHWHDQLAALLARMGAVEAAAAFDSGATVQVKHLNAVVAS